MELKLSSLARITKGMFDEKSSNDWWEQHLPQKCGFSEVVLCGHRTVYVGKNVAHYISKLQMQAVNLAIPEI